MIIQLVIAADSFGQQENARLLLVQQGPEPDFVTPLRFEHGRGFVPDYDAQFSRQDAYYSVAVDMVADTANGLTDGMICCAMTDALLQAMIETQDPVTILVYLQDFMSPATFQRHFQPPKKAEEKKAAREDGALAPCGICLEQISGTDVRCSTNASHRFCADCFESWLVQNTPDTKFAQCCITSKDKKCNGIFDIRAWNPSTTAGKRWKVGYEDHCVRACVMGVMVVCPGCKQESVKELSIFHEAEIQCPYCGTTMCSACHYRVHNGMSCENAALCRATQNSLHKELEVEGLNLLVCGHCNVVGVVDLQHCCKSVCSLCKGITCACCKKPLVETNFRQGVSLHSGLAYRSAYNHFCRPLKTSPVLKEHCKHEPGEEHCYLWFHAKDAASTADEFRRNFSHLMPSSEETKTTPPEIPDVRKTPPPPESPPKQEDIPESPLRKKPKDDEAQIREEPRQPIPRTPKQAEEKKTKLPKPRLDWRRVTFAEKNPAPPQKQVSKDEEELSPPREIPPTPKQAEPSEEKKTGKLRKQHLDWRRGRRK